MIEALRSAAPRPLYLDLPLERRDSRHGDGAFATRDLPRGTVVLPKWNESFYDAMEGWVCRTAQEVLALPAEQRSLFLKYGLDLDFDLIVGPLHRDYVHTADNFINHACAPNLQFDTAGNVVAAIDIRKDQELFVDYGCFAVNFDEPFECGCKAPHCRGRVRRRDWMALAAVYRFNLPTFLHPWIRLRGI